MLRYDRKDYVNRHAFESVPQAESDFELPTKARIKGDILVKQLRLDHQLAVIIEQFDIRLLIFLITCQSGLLR